MSWEPLSMSERQQILSKLERVWDLNPDKSLAEILMGAQIVGGLDMATEDAWILECLEAIIDEHENGECP